MDASILHGPHGVRQSRERYGLHNHLCAIAPRRSLQPIFHRLAVSELVVELRYSEEKKRNKSMYI